MRTVSEAVTIERSDDDLLITIHGRGLVDPDFLAAFHAVLDTAENDHPGTAVVTTGTDKFFSNGFDLDYLGSLDRDGLAEFIDDACRLVSRILTFPAPTVAAVNGHAFGIGAMFVLAHDQSVMRSDRGWFCLPEIDLGLSFHPFMQALVTHRLGPRVADAAVLSGRRYDGAASLEAGIVDAIASGDELVAQAAARLGDRRGKDPRVLRAIKRQYRAEVTRHTPD
jgi:Delta3-Delta2-enoyl-CoA isomerase